MAPTEIEPKQRFGFSFSSFIGSHFPETCRYENAAVSVDDEREPMDVHTRLSMEEETDCMAVEDVDVRYESRMRRSELCWLCLRCFADEDDDLQDFDDQWRKIKCNKLTVRKQIYISMIFFQAT